MLDRDINKLSHFYTCGIGSVLTARLIAINSIERFLMKYKIDENEDGLDISVDKIKDNKKELLQAFRECQAGRCSCPTEEYNKLESLDVEQGEDVIKLHIKSRKGVKIDKAEINRCLDYTAERIEKNTKE